MKILIDAHLSENKLTGIGRYLNGLITSLLKIDQNNEYFLLIREGIAPSHPLSKLEAGNLKKIPVHLRGVSPCQHIVIPKILSKVKPGIYHHPHFDLPLFQQYPSVITVHDVKYIRYPEYFSQKRHTKAIYMKKMLKSSLHRSKKVIAVSKSTKKDILELFDVNEDKIVVVHHGLTNRFTEENHSDINVLKKYGIHSKFILFVGERRPHKNIVNLIKAFKILLNSVKEKLQLLIIGKGYSNYTEPEKIIVKENLNSKVVLTGFVPDNELQILYQEAEMLVLPSFYEGFGFPLIEAMTLKTPVLGSNRTSIPEIIGNAGLLFNPDNVDELATKMKLLIQNNTLKKKIITKGFQRAKQFTWQNVARQTLEIYKEVFTMRSA